MMKLLYVLAVGVVAFCGSVAAGGFHRCPPPIGKRPFDDQKFSGDWYVAAKAPVKNVPSIPTTCRKLHYSTEKIGNETRVDIKMDITDADGTKKTPEVKAREIHAGPGGSSVLQAVWRISPEEKWHGVLTVSALATDYDTYAVILGCKEKYHEQTDSFDRIMVPEIWSRQPSLDGEVLAVLKNLLSGFDIDVATITDMNNSGC